MGSVTEGYSGFTVGAEGELRAILGFILSECILMHVYTVCGVLLQLLISLQFLIDILADQV